MRINLPRTGTKKGLNGILQPLVDVLSTIYEKSESYDSLVLIEVSGGQMYRLKSPYPNGVIIELPPRLPEHPQLASAVATLLQRSGSDQHWYDHADGESDPCRTPLRFCFVKKTIWVPSDSCLSEGGHLMVDAIVFDPVAAERQVALLAKHLEDGANLFTPSASDLAMF